MPKDQSLVHCESSCKLGSSESIVNGRGLPAHVYQAPSKSKSKLTWRASVTHVPQPKGDVKAIDRPLPWGRGDETGKTLQAPSLVTSIQYRARLGSRP